MFTLLCSLAAALVIAGSAYQLLYNLFLTPLTAYPGPFFFKISHVPADYYRLKGTFHLKLHELHELYGPVVRTRPNELSSIKGKTWAEVYAHRPGQQEMIKSEAGPRSNGVEGISSASTDLHRRYRKLFSYAFSNQGMREQEPRIQYHVNLMVRGLGERSGKGPVDIGSWFNWTTFDIIGDLSFGESFDCLVNAKTHPWINNIQKMFPAAIAVVLIQAWGLLPLIALVLPKSMKDTRDTSRAFITNKLLRRLEHREKDRGDFLDHVLQYDIVPDEKPLSGHTKGMSIRELESTATDLVFAGSETTATLLSGIVYFLLQNPAMLQRATKEVRSTYSSDEYITLLNATAEKLPFLMAVVQEGLRIYPPAPVLTNRSVPQGGAVVDGRHLSQGTRIGVAQYPAFLSPYNFHRPDEFLPERWLPDRPKEFQNDNPDGVFQPFSVGPRNCMGMNLANGEARLILSKLLWRFDLSKPARAGKEWDEWLTGQKVYILWIKDALMVNVTVREDIEQ